MTETSGSYSSEYASDSDTKTGSSNATTQSSPIKDEIEGDEGGLSPIDMECNIQADRITKSLDKLVYQTKLAISIHTLLCSNILAEILTEPHLQLVSSTVDHYNVPLYFESQTNMAGIEDMKAWDLVCDRKYLLSLVQPLTQLGILLGNFGFGILADRIGRKIPLMIAVVLQAILMIITTFMPTFELFLIFKSLSAIATGGTMLISFVIVMEIIGAQVRSNVLTLYHVPFVLGILTVPLFSYLTRTWDGYWVMISVPAFGLLSYYWLIPESPRWLLAVGRVEQARKVLLKAAKTNKISETKVITAIEKYENLLPLDTKCIEADSDQRSYGVMDLVRTPNMRLKTICIVFNWLKCGMVFFGIEHYLGHMSDNVLSDLAISAAFQLPGLLIVFFLISRVSRLKILIVANVLAGISLLLIIPFYNSDTMKLVLVTIALTCMTVSFPTIYLYTGELFPTVVRNIGFAVCSIASKTGSIFAPFLIDYVDDLTYWVIPVVFGLGPVLGAILCIWLPETMNCKLPETIEDGENFKRKKQKSPAASPL